MASTEERLARIEGGYAHIATRADIAEIKSELRLHRWALGVVIASQLILIARVFEIIPA